MRKSTALSWITALLLGASVGASAEDLTGSTLSIAIGALPPITVGQTTDPFTVSVASDGSFTLPSSFFGPTTIALPRALFTGVPQIVGLTIAGLANGNLPLTPAGGPNGDFGGTGALAGNSLVNILQIVNLTIPLSVVGGIPGGTTMVTSGNVVVTVIGGPWGTGPQMITGLTSTTPNTAVVNTVTFAGSDSRPNELTLVSAFKVLTNVAGNLPGVATKNLRFVPEPTGGLLAAVGGAVLALVAGVRRMRR